MTETLSSLLGLTERVERLVGEGNWIEASAVEADRRRLLEEYVAQSGADREHLRTLLERSRRTLATAAGQRAALLAESSELGHRRRALEAYAAHDHRPLAGTAGS